MTDLTLLIVVAAMVAFAVLAMIFGSDSRPGIERGSDGWVASRR